MYEKVKNFMSHTIVVGVLAILGLLSNCRNYPSEREEDAQQAISQTRCQEEEHLPLTLTTLDNRQLQNIFTHLENDSVIATLGVSQSLLESTSLSDSLVRQRFLITRKPIATWKKLGIEIKASEIPEIPIFLLEAAKDLQTKGKRPIVVLDPGLSVEELETKVRDYSSTLQVLNPKDSEDGEKFRQEASYKAKGSGMNWLLLPGSDHGVLPGSREKNYADQVSHMEANYRGFRVGTARELATVCMLKQLQDGTILFGQEGSAHGTWARTADMWQANYKGHRIGLGAFGYSDSPGLVVSYYHDAFWHSDYSGCFCVFSAPCFNASEGIEPRNA